MNATMVSDDDDTLVAKEELDHVKEEAFSGEQLLILPPGTLVVGPPGTTTVSRRIRANPLKHLAHLLRQKLIAAHGAPCNLLQVALEIHSQAQDKHNTTLRRIYDVVNVCEGAGVLARSGPKSSELKEKTASDQTLLQRCFPFRRTGKRNLRGGAAIQWVGGSSDGAVGDMGRTPEIPRQNHKLLLMEKGQTVDRIVQKGRVCDTLSKQVAILQNLVEQNQALCRLHQDGSMSGAEAQFPSDLGEPISMGRESSVVSEVVASMSSEMEPSKTTAGDRDIYTDLSSLHSLEGCCDVDYLVCDSFVDQPRPSSTDKRLHLPFVMLATNPDANVEICMNGDPPHEVHLQLDQSYCLMDHIQMIKMLPEGRVEKHQ